MSPSAMSRTITIILAAPPGDGLRVAREHFHDYVRPILVAAALNWDVIEGRKEGEIQTGLAEKIRKMREKGAEQRSQPKENDLSQDEALEAARKALGIREWDGIKGDLIIGRHTWKEYVRGLHEGWLGPMDPPQDPTVPSEDVISAEPTDQPPKDESSSEDTTKKTDPKAVTPPYITPSSYSAANLSPNCPSELSPSTAIPLPHILGFLNTPKRMYRFLQRRKLADSTGASVAALVLAAQTRPYRTEAEVDDFSASMETASRWEQDALLKEAESEWYKSAWAPNKEGEERERPWQEDMVLDPRIGEQMRTFELPQGSETKAEELEEKARRERDSWWMSAKKWAGYGPREKRGWEMGFEGGEDD